MGELATSWILYCFVIASIALLLMILNFDPVMFLWNFVSTPTGKQEHFQRLMRYIQQGRVIVPEEAFEATTTAIAAEDLPAGALVKLDGTVVGVAIEDSDEEEVTTIVTGTDRPAAFPAPFHHHGVGSIHASYATYGSIAYGGGMRDITGEFMPRTGRYQYTEKFPPEVREKAWKLVEQHMTPDQYFAFMEGTNVELENIAGDFRLIISKTGRFTILEGARGTGIVAQAGTVSSYKYPLGDEISAFIDWFNHRTKELIAQWGCGTYGIVGENLRR